MVTGAYVASEMYIISDESDGRTERIPPHLGHDSGDARWPGDVEPEPVSISLEAAAKIPRSLGANQVALRQVCNSAAST